MNWSLFFLIIIALAFIVSGLIILLRTAKPLRLSKKELSRIKAREIEQKRKDDQNHAH